jgi:hypothetical protein
MRKATSLSVSKFDSFSAFIWRANFDAGEAEVAHRTHESGISREAEHAGAFAVVEISVAVETAGVTRDGELHVVPRARGEVQALKGIRGPVVLALRIAAVVAMVEAELHLAGFLRRPQGPGALEFRGGERGGRQHPGAQRRRHECLQLFHSTSAFLSWMI